MPVYPSIKFNSVAVAVTNVPPSNNPFVPSCEATSKSYAPSAIVTSPLASAVNTLDSSEVPWVVTSRVFISAVVPV